MPIYEYQCTGCNHHFDLMQKMNEEPIKTCPKCAQDKATRLVSAAGFQLKGSGWYATDFKNKGQSSTSSETSTTPASPSETTSTSSSGSDAS